MTFLSMRKASIWWNIGECVASSSRRKTVPGAMKAIGGFSDFIARIWMFDVWVRRSLLDLVQKRVLHVRRRGDLAARKPSIGEVVRLVLDLGVVEHGEAELTEDGDDILREPSRSDVADAARRPRGMPGGQREIEGRRRELRFALLPAQIVQTLIRKPASTSCLSALSLLANRLAPSGGAWPSCLRIAVSSPFLPRIFSRLPVAKGLARLWGEPT